MNDLLLRRRNAIISDPTVYPYDSKVAYIESNGSQGLCIPYYPNPLTYMQVDMQFVDIGNKTLTGASNTLYSANSSTMSFSANFGGGATQSNAIYIWNDKPSSQGGATKWLNTGNKTTRTNFIVENNKCSAFGSTLTLNPKTTTNISYLYFLCNATNVFFNRWGVKVYSFTIKENGVPIVNAIPVRVGQVGCLYDKVSGQLINNIGTSDFILGNDIT